MATVLERCVGKDAPLDRRIRVLGAILLLVGLFLTKTGVIDTLREAERHEAPKLAFVPVAVGFVPLTLLLGTATLLGGGRVIGFAKRLGLERRPDGSRSAGGWVLMGLIIAPGFVLYLWLQQRLQELGYGR